MGWGGGGKRLVGKVRKLSGRRDRKALLQCRGGVGRPQGPAGEACELARHEFTVGPSYWPTGGFAYLSLLTWTVSATPSTFIL